MIEQEVIDAIYELNSQYYEHNNKFDIVCPFVAICTGYQTIVKFFDIPIWNSDDDDREFNNTSNEYTPISSYLIKKRGTLHPLFKHLIINHDFLRYLRQRID